MMSLRYLIDACKMPYTLDQTVPYTQRTPREVTAAYYHGTDCNIRQQSEGDGGDRWRMLLVLPHLAHEELERRL